MYLVFVCISLARVFIRSISGNLNEHDLHSLIYLNTGSPLGGCLGRIKRCGLVGGCVTRQQAVTKLPKPSALPSVLCLSSAVE